MQIDWITVLAQLVNFGLLVWLLHKLLYAPVIKLVAAREAEISSRTEAAEALAKTADDDGQRLTAERDALNASREQVIAKAESAGEEKARALMQQAREKASEARATWQKDMQILTERQTQQLARDAVDQLENIASRCLHDLANEPMQTAMAKQLVGSLRNMPAKERDEFRRHLSDGPVSVTSSSNSIKQTRSFIESALSEIAGVNIAVEFQTDKTLSPGLVLKAGRQSFAWTIESYLTDFMQHVRETLDTDKDFAGAASSKIGVS